jgi:DNA-binding IclR family transcriptional regulator
MSTADRLLNVLGLFTLDRSKWTVEAAALELNMTVSTTYRYFKSLVDAGLLAADRPRHYTLGPAIIEYDRQMRLRDPLIVTAMPIMKRLADTLGADAMVLLCRLFRRRVLCVHQETVGPQAFHTHWQQGQPIIYQRGQPMPLHRGAPSKAILAHMKARQVRPIYEEEAHDWNSAGLGQSWMEVKRSLRMLRNAKVVTTTGEISDNTTGIAVPLLMEQTGVVGSLSIILPPDRRSGPGPDAAAALAEAARAIEQGLVADPDGREP